MDNCPVIAPNDGETILRSSYSQKRIVRSGAGVCLLESTFAITVSTWEVARLWPSRGNDIIIYGSDPIQEMFFQANTHVHSAANT